MNLDVFTLQCIFVGVCIAVAIILSLPAQRNGKDGLTLWSLGLCLNAAAYIIWGLKLPHLPLPQALISLSYVVFTMAIYRLLRQSFPVRWIIAPPVIMFFGGLFFMHSRIDLTIFVCVILFLQILFLCGKVLRTRFPYFTVGKYLLLSGGGIVLLINAMRIAVALSVKAALLDHAILHEITELSFLLAFFSVTITAGGFALMTRESMPRQDNKSR